MSAHDDLQLKVGNSVSWGMSVQEFKEMMEEWSCPH